MRIADRFSKLAAGSDHALVRAHLLLFQFLVIGQLKLFLESREIAFFFFNLLFFHHSLAGSVPWPGRLLSFVTHFGRDCGSAFRCVFLLLSFCLMMRFLRVLKQRFFFWFGYVPAESRSHVHLFKPLFRRDFVLVVVFVNGGLVSIVLFSRGFLNNRRSGSHLNLVMLFACLLK